MMRAFRWLTFMLAGLLLPVSSGASGFEEKGFNVTPFVGWTIFDKELKSPFLPMLEDNLYIGGRVSARIFDPLWLDIAGGWTTTTDDNDEDVLWSHLTGNLMLMSSTPRLISPFISLGGGISQFDPLPQGFWSDSKRDGVFEAAAGVRVRLSEVLGLRLEARNVLLVPKTQWNKAHIDNVIVGAGLVFAFGGGAPDTDGDGVNDTKDTCPSTPRECRVDANGCPSDEDGDGVCDELDRCAGTLRGATVDSRGCPADTDGDRVLDGLDACPDSPRGCTVDARGCPVDSDGDGVCDGLDRCEATPAGCRVAVNGCPLDEDGDGVCDGLDNCPNTPAGATVGPDGCPPDEVRQRETELLDTGKIVLRDVHFATAKATILPESHAALNVVGQVLSKWPQLRVEIGGHCDSRGSDAYNQALSQRRAAAVRAYLLENFPGLESGQLTAKGYGESRPQVPNTSDENMALNRRVEFEVLNREVLQQLKP
jgi:OOP family OmpA-OmpF porin